jgi:hypothetical protein
VYNIVRISSKDTEENNKNDHMHSEGQPILGETDKLINAVYGAIPIPDAESPSSSSEIKVHSFYPCYIIFFMI